MTRLMEDDYVLVHNDAADRKWGKFPYEKTTYANGSIGFLHLTPEEYDKEIHTAYKKAAEEEANDLKRLGEIMEKDMLGWWD